MYASGAAAPVPAELAEARPRSLSPHPPLEASPLPSPRGVGGMGGMDRWFVEIYDSVCPE